MNVSTLLIIALAASLIVILLGVFALIMALVRFRKQKSSGDPQMQKEAGYKLVPGIVSAVLLFVVGAVMTVIVLINIFK